MRILLCLAFFLVPAIATAFDPLQINKFADEVVSRHALDRDWVVETLGEAKLQQSILDAISRPAEKTRPWHEYRALFINDRRINDGAAFYREHRDTLEQVATECGIPAEIIVAILGIETHYGQRAGSYRVIDALSTLAFAYPPRAAFFRSELEQFLLLAREHDVDPVAVEGSYAGAMGAAQFISSSYRRYAVDSSGDGSIDLWSDWRDVIGSVANYLHTFGWRRHEPITEMVVIESALATPFIGEKLELDRSLGELRQAAIPVTAEGGDDQPAMLFELEDTDGPVYWVGYNNFYVITRYNRSRMYAMAVHDLGAEIASRVAAR